MFHVHLIAIQHMAYGPLTDGCQGAGFCPGKDVLAGSRDFCSSQAEEEGGAAQL